MFFFKILYIVILFNTGTFSTVYLFSDLSCSSTNPFDDIEAKKLYEDGNKKMKIYKLYFDSGIDK